MSLRRLLGLLRRPRDPERTRVNRLRWESLPESLKTPQQVLGRGYVACGATHGVMEKCNFGCTSCYLSDVANSTDPLPLEEVERQLDDLRRELGPAGKTQITSGEVTLLPVDHLGRIVRYAREVGLDPMVMTHGQQFIEQPDYLPALVREYGLRKVAIHVDSTQRGRPGVHRRAGERELDDVRGRFATLIRRVRKDTGKKLHAAHTVTVTRDNVEAIAGTMRWILDNADAFRMVSFQPIAEVGRTRDTRGGGTTMDEVWRRICDGLGRPVHRHGMHFGHPECNIVCPVVVVSFAGCHEILESVRESSRWDRRVMRRILEAAGGFSTLGMRPLEIATAVLAMGLRNPWLVAELAAYGVARLWAIRSWLPSALLSFLRGRGLRVQPLAIVVHKFMDADELETPLGRERLDACVFKVPVDGRMVSMCEVNATGIRRRLNETAHRSLGREVPLRMAR